MPRGPISKDPRGGRRQLAQGATSGNRTDLNEHQAPMAATGQGYGVKGAQLEAQRQIPLPNTPQQMAPQQPQMAQAPVGPAPGSLPFDHPTNRPNEPITAGMPFGPGGGPEMLGQAPSVAQQLSAMASMPNASSTLQDIAAAARQVGF